MRTRKKYVQTLAEGREGLIVFFFNLIVMACSKSIDYATCKVACGKLCSAGSISWLQSSFFVTGFLKWNKLYANFSLCSKDYEEMNGGGGMEKKKLKNKCKKKERRKKKDSLLAKLFLHIRAAWNQDHMPTGPLSFTYFSANLFFHICTA